MTDPKFIVGLDLDGVCADYEAGLRAYLVDKTGRPPASFPQATDWSYSTSGWFDRSEDYLPTHLEAVGNGLFAGLPAVAGVRRGTQRLAAAGCHIRIITHRLMSPTVNARAASDTITWLAQQRIRYDELCFVAKKTDVRADAYVDDAPHNILAFTDAGDDVVIFDQLYNRSIPGRRATDWHSLTDQILRLKFEKEMTERSARRADEIFRQATGREPLQGQIPEIIASATPDRDDSLVALLAGGGKAFDIEEYARAAFTTNGGLQ